MAQEVLMAGESNTQYPCGGSMKSSERLTALPGPAQHRAGVARISSAHISVAGKRSDRSRRTAPTCFINTLDARGLYTVDPIGDITQSAPQYATGKRRDRAQLYRIQGARGTGRGDARPGRGTGGYRVPEQQRSVWRDSRDGGKAGCVLLDGVFAVGLEE